MLEIKKKHQLQKNNTNENPIRDEILSPERLEQYAQFLTKKLLVEKTKSAGRSLLPRLNENEDFLKTVYNELTSFLTKDIFLSPAGDWIVDNFHIIQDQIREIKEDLPKRYYIELPKIDIGELKGYPRVYALSLTMVAHLDSQLDINTLERFISSYQTKSPLLIGEIWAIPIALRIALIENLRRLSFDVAQSQKIKNKVNFLADKLEKSYKNASIDTSEIITELSNMLGKNNKQDFTILSQLSQRLHSLSPEIVPACQVIEDYLKMKDLSIEEVVNTEHNQQVITQSSVSNAINSMRLLSNTNWKDFFENLSIVDKILQQDPIDAYKNMDFKSRDLYRNSVEKINKKSGVDEIEIAQAALNLANKAIKQKVKGKHRYHVGYYLIKNGVEELEHEIGYKAPFLLKLKRKILHKPSSLYFAFFISLTLALLLPVITYTKWITQSYIWTTFIFLLAFIPASDSALNILNLFITNIITPNILPKMNLRNGIPNSAKTFVVVPTIISNSRNVSTIIEDLEIRFLANQENNLYFAILSDFKDAKSETLASDKDIIKELLSGIKKLNNKYNVKEERFYLFHRKRIWNKKESKWIGWERKRGKIVEFNRFLKGEKNTSFIIHPPISKFLSKIKYVITLDTDTKLPRNAAKKLVGTILHPLNIPQYDKVKGIVTYGYSILQPRISITPKSSKKSYFSRIFSGNTGIDPYTTAVSDTYQDLFGEGIYTGKGLYAIDSFEASLKNRIPENTILSHDLLEGLHARTALVTDIELLDDYPTHYLAYAQRLHRWIRGDWQILKWIFPKVPNHENQKITNPISLLSKWKIIDNLRRSLVQPITLIWFVLSWTVVPGDSVIWTTLIITVLMLPIYSNTTSKLFKYPKDLSILIHFKSLFNDFKTNILQLGILIIVLPYQSLIHVDAISKSIYRLYYSKKNLLNWKASAEVENGLNRSKSLPLKTLIFLPTLAFLLFLLIFNLNPKSLMISSPFLLLWFFSPQLIRYLSEPIIIKPTELSNHQIETIRMISRRTWNYFETFVTKETNWLPPDNFQSEPKNLLAERTSPTNIGMYLLSICSAYNLGYICTKELLERIENTISSIGLLQKRFGHLYNWYDTKTLHPLQPEYISTVDSGNLAGHLITVKQMCHQIFSKEFKSHMRIEGLADIFNIIKDDIHRLEAMNIPESKTINKTLNSQVKLIINLITTWDIFSETKEYHFINSIRQEIDYLINYLDSAQIKSSENIYFEVKSWVKKAIKYLNNYENQLKENLNLSHLKKLQNRALTCEKQIQKIINNMDFSIVYDDKIKLFSIGYSLSTGTKDDSYYDLLASEARLASLISIAKGDVPEEHWFHLGRQMTSLYNQRILISWSASMFEYLMPQLIVNDYNGTILNESHYSAVKLQITYGQMNKFPWGLSESAYNARDLQMNYQYGPFGVPGIGLKRGLSEDYVISPYSTALALMVLPKESMKNFDDLISMNLLTKYGFYEAIDFSRKRIPPNEEFAVVKSFMAHHQGMTIVAIDNVINKNKLRTLFHSDATIRSIELLLQERLPKKISLLHPRNNEVDKIVRESTHDVSPIQNIYNVCTSFPITRVLSNGSYTTLLSATGSGFSKNKDVYTYRWKEDATLDNHGQYLFMFNHSTNELISSTFSPLNQNQQAYYTTFSDHKAEYYFEKDNLKLNTEIIVSAEDNVEIKKITINNISNQPQHLELTSYCEPTLSTLENELAHPSYNKLFFETDFIFEKNTLIAKKRKKSNEESDLYAIHKIIFNKNICKELQYETDRLKFRGRMQTWEEAIALRKNKKLENTLGATLDPILSFKIKIELKPFETTKVQYINGVTQSKEDLLKIIDQYQDFNAFEREDKMSWTRNQIELRHLNLNHESSHTYQKYATALIYSVNNAQEEIQPKHVKNMTQQDLWGFGISGDLPILAVLIKNKAFIDIVQELLQLHEYLRRRNIKFDLVIITEESSNYRMDVHEEILQQVRMAGLSNLLNEKGGIFLIKGDMISKDHLNLIRSCARVYLTPKGTNLRKIADQTFTPSETPWKQRVNSKFVEIHKNNSISMPHLKLFNGIGGFNNDGSEYQIHLQAKNNTPSPWINVISNSNSFGFTVSESGSSYTWSLNSRENRITPWHDDPVLDQSGEILYIRDRETHKTWCPTPAPIRNNSSYLISHGQGYTRFEHKFDDIESNLTMFVCVDKDIKYFRLSIKNNSSSERFLSVYLYLEWVLGIQRENTSQHISCDQIKNIHTAQNNFSSDFHSRVSFCGSNKNITSFTCDRKSFLGRHRSYQDPIGLDNKNFQTKYCKSNDPCLALKVDINLISNQEDEVIFILGQDNADLLNIESINKYLSPATAELKYKEVINFWEKLKNKIQIKTNVPEFDYLINNWTIYQTISCRLWARTGFYQSGGAYGFRDQLQDVLSLLQIRPEMARKQILLAASKQFKEGDVLHWWHPPTNKGVRTRFSDDLLWLPYATDSYIEVTGDVSILETMVHFIEGPILNKDQTDLYIQAKESSEKVTLLEHCFLAIDRSLKLGAHDLPLIGSGDWNDGMNLVGHQGKGESVWMAWFLGFILERYIKIAKENGDLERAKTYHNKVVKIKKAVNTNGWDGNWYRRAYFDDGTVIGSSSNEECKIDSISQSWSIISGLGEKNLIKKALKQAENHLVDHDHKIVKLFTPPFDKTSPNPGYIMGYIPGVRENGGQYSHAAIWLAIAYAKNKDFNLAYNVLKYVNPIYHTKNIQEVTDFMNEPYVISADIYSNGQHMGKGGWSWYTGSSAWFYKAFLENTLGINRKRNLLLFSPAPPDEMKTYEVKYQFKSNIYNLSFEENEKNELWINDKFVNSSLSLLLKDENKKYDVLIRYTRTP